MSQLSLKRRSPLALVAAAEPKTNRENLLINSYALDRSFYGWLADSNAQPAQNFRRSLSTEDFLQVELATVREGHNHRRWPPDIIAKFLRADVIGR